MSSLETVQNFRAVTGCESDGEAAHYLDACNDNLAAAVDLFFQRQQTDQPPQKMQSHRYPNRRQQQGDRLSEGPSTSNDDVAMNSDGDDEVRAPMAPTRGVIVEQSYNQTYNQRGRRRQATNSVFDRFRDFRAEGRNQRDMLTRDQQRDPRAVPETEHKRQTLESLFRPPVDLIHEGNWESARHAAEVEGRWLLVNVQNVEEFACQTLNRDVWANEGVRELVRNNFVFWQVYHDSPDGSRMETYYRLGNYPAIFVVDPRTGEFIVSFSRVQDAVSFCDQVTAFLDEHPEFASRDRQMSAIASASSSVAVNSAQAPIASSTSNGIGAVTSRKRAAFADEAKNGHGNGNGSAGFSSQPPTKSAKMDDSDSGSPLPDIDALVNGGEKLTTVDQDEWKKHLGSGGENVSLVLRLPNGSKERISIPDSTNLKAVFLFVAGRGYSAVDHLLVLSFPRREFSADDGSKTLKAIGFNRQEMIDVERK